LFDATFKKQGSGDGRNAVLCLMFRHWFNGVSWKEAFSILSCGLQHTVAVLDFEDNPHQYQTLEELVVRHSIHDKLGRWPGFYSGHTIKRALGTSVDPVLKNCWFWLAQYGPTPVVPPCWNTWTMWQYTDGGVGPMPHGVNGIGSCDRENYNGTNAQLKNWWGK
jgi:lysozyme